MEQPNMYEIKKADVGGRPVSYTPEELRTKINEYIQFVLSTPIKLEKLFNTARGIVRKSEKHIRPMTVTGCAVYLGITPETLNNYAKRGDEDPHREEYLRIVSQAKAIFYQQKFNGATIGAYNPSIIARDLGLAEKKVIEDKTIKALEVRIID